MKNKAVAIILGFPGSAVVTLGLLPRFELGADGAALLGLAITGRCRV